MDRMVIERFGPIERADITLGDLTVFVGPQATGKSIALQMLRLQVDRDDILDNLRFFGFDWSGKTEDFLETYLGEGMGGIWHEARSRIQWNDSQVSLQEITTSQSATGNEEGPLAKPQMFYIPAQRVLTIANGWPRPFSDYTPATPYALRHFSSMLTSLMLFEFNKASPLFPDSERFTPGFEMLLNRSVFSGLVLHVDRRFSQKRLVLQKAGSKDPLPFMVWSSGQKEVIPLLLGLSWLMTAERSRPRREAIEWIVIEEPEMGLHSRAISVVLLMTLELLRRGYRVALSTHSPHVLDLVWALRVLREHNADPDQVLALFDVGPDEFLREIAASALESDLRVHYFDTDGYTHDITRLDPGSDNSAEASWGGLGEFSSRVADVVADVVAVSEKRGRE